MHRLHSTVCALLLAGGLAGSAWAAQPPATGATNDTFAAATLISGEWGSITGCNTNAVPEPGDPNNAGFAPAYPIWYKWTAPQDGEVSMDTLGSHCLSTTTSFGEVTNIITNVIAGVTNTFTNVLLVLSTNTFYGPMDTVLGVYAGSDLAHLTQIAANDDIEPFLLQKDQYQGGGIFGAYAGSTIYNLPFGGPSGLRFNATYGTTYYICIDSKGATTANSVGTGSIFGSSTVAAPNGFPLLNWAYHPSGVFRFASEQFDWTNSIGPIPMYYCTPLESMPDWDANYKTYYTYFPTGVVVTVTRWAGSSGRVLVDYATADGSAMAGFDYEPVSGTLVFDDFEMSKDIVVPIIGSELYPAEQPGGGGGRGMGGGPGIGAPLGYDFYVYLTNPRLDPVESLDVSPPRIDISWSNSMVRVLNYALVQDFTTNRDVFNFSKVHYRFPEDVNTYYANALLTIYRTAIQSHPTEGVTLHYRVNAEYLDTIDPANWDNFFPLEPGCDYATPNPAVQANINATNSDYTLADGDVTFGGNDDYKTISFTITNDGFTKFARTFKVSFWRDAESPMTGEVAAGTADECYVTILFNDQNPPAGSVDELYDPDLTLSMALPFVPYSDPPDMDQPGADGQVLGLLVFPNSAVVTNVVGTNTVVVTNTLDKTIYVGDFGSFNTYPRNRIARVQANGSLDPSFLAPPLSGADAFITCIASAANNKILVAGAFASFNGQNSPGIALLNDDGSLDVTDFSPGLGVNGTVRAALPLPNGQFLIAGDFTFYNGSACSHIARLNPNGSLDTSFQPPTITGHTINALAVSHGQIFIGGDFTAIGTNLLEDLACLNPDGSLNLPFANNLGVGLDGMVHALAIDAAGNLLVGGEFLHVAGVASTRIARFNPSGFLDPTFGAGSGTDNTIFTILPQTNGTIYVGGAFTTFNGTHRLGFTRLYANGNVDTSFLDTGYNQFAGLHRERFVDPPGVVYAAGIQSDGNVIIGGSFQQVGGGQANPAIRIDPLDTFGSYNQNVDSEAKTRAGLRNRLNIARLIGGSSTGPGNLSLSDTNYSVLESSASVTVALTRTNGTLGYLSANLSVPSGVAQSGIDYAYSGSVPTYLTAWRLYDYLPAAPPNALTRCFADGLFGSSAAPTDIYGSTFFNYTPLLSVISVVHNNTRGNRSASITLANPSCADQFYLGGETLPISGALGLATAPFTIVDDNHSPGSFGFALTNYTVNENAGYALISVIRTNGSYGNISLRYATTLLGTAVIGQDYWPTNGSLFFADGITNVTFAVPIINNTNIQSQDRIVSLNLTYLSSGSWFQTNAALAIINDNYPIGFVNFSQASYSTNESAGAIVLTLTRTGGSRGAISVTCSTTNTGSALPNINYQSLSTNLVWNSGDSSPRHVVVPLLDNGLVGTNTFFDVVLSEPVAYGTNAPTMLLGSIVSANVTIINDNYYGSLAFSAPTYYVNEIGGYTTITVVRTGGAAQTVTASFATADGTAVSTGPQQFRNYAPTNGTLTFGPGQIAQSFTVPIYNDGVVDPANFFFTVSLTNQTPAGSSLGFPSTALVNIIDAQTVNAPAGSPDPGFPASPGLNGDVLAVGVQTNGKILAAGDFTFADGAAMGHITRFNADSTLDSTFLNDMSGANAAVNQLLIQTDGSILIGGAFTTFNGVDNFHIARLLTDGSLDSSFDAGAGADGDVFALAESFPPGGTNRSLLVGGSFTHLHSVAVSSLARLYNNGSIDSTFLPTFNSGSTIYALALYPTNVPHAGQILVGGDFSTVNGIARNGIARLNPDGSLDPTFDPGQGATNGVRAIAIQLDGNLLVGGSFTNFNAAPLHYVARLNPDGSLDSTFTANVGPGTDDTVDAIVLQPDTRIVLVGAFTHANGVTRPHITRLLPDGSVDPSINFGYGANSYINAVALQPNGMLVVGGGFTTFDRQPRYRLARLFGGSMAGAGALTFSDPLFEADETATNALITVQRTGGTAGAVSIAFATANNTAISGVNYSNVSATLNFPNGETFQSILVPVIDDFRITPDLTVNLSLSNPQGGAALGDQYVATLLIFNDDSSVSFASTNYSVLQNIPTGLAEITLARNGGTRTPASVTFYTITNGTALPDLDYLTVSNTVVFPVGQSNIVAAVPIRNDSLMLNDSTVDLGLTNASGAFLFTPASAVLTILTTNTSPGQFVLAQTNYFVPGTNGAVAPVTVLRTNGHTGAVTVQFATFSLTNFSSAVPNVDYAPTNGTLTFADGELSKTLFIPIFLDPVIHGNLSFSLNLSKPSLGTSIIPPDSASIIILNAEQGVGFPSSSYVTNETAPAVILQVQRLLTNGTTTVSYATADETALAGINYVPPSGPLTNLTFLPGETTKSVSIPLKPHSQITGSLFFHVNLYPNPTNPVPLYPYASALVNLLDDNTGFSFTNSNFGVLKNGTNVLITVTRTNADTGLANVSFSTRDLSALANVDYYPTNGILTFSNGIVFQSFTVPIINNRTLEGNRNFAVELITNAATLGAGQLLPPSTATITITDDIAGLSFSSPAYRVSEKGGQAVISVLRTGFTNCSLTVDFATASGTNSGSAIPGVNYMPTNGILLFTNGVTVQSFAVPVIDDDRVDGDHAVQLSLANPTVVNSPLGFAVLTATNAATLTILEADGSFIVSAGAALTFSRSFTNPAAISLATANGAGSSYPSIIAVSNLFSQVENTAIRLPSASISAADRLAALLAGPSGATTLFMANAGGATPLSGASLSFDDLATNTLPAAAPLTNTPYSPAAYAPLPVFPNAPPSPYGTNFAPFIDSSPNGNWSLYALDSTAPFAGSLSNGWALDLTCLETNSARVIEPGETVTMLFALRNGGGPDVTNLIATLLATNGVTEPSASQSYGPMPAGGPSTSRLFTFTPVGTNGQVISPTFLLQDGTSPLSSSPVFNFTLGTSTSSYSNNAPILIPQFSPASPYPSTINVVGFGNLVSKTTVTLTNLAHTWPSDINILLLAPSGQKSYLMSKCGGSYTITNTTLTFDPAATNQLPYGAPITNGTYAATAYPVAPPPFPLPAPASTPSAPYYTNMAIFDGINPNGIWSLFVYDDSHLNSGIISNGWLLNLTTSTPIQPAADVGVSMSAQPSSVILTSNLTFTVNVMNYGPGIASNVVISDTLPLGASNVSYFVSEGQVSTNAPGLLTWDVGTLLKGAQASMSLTVEPFLVGTATNSASVFTTTADLNPSDSTAAAGANVVGPTADLFLSLLSLPNLVTLGDTYTLSATVTNLGPASAPGLTVVFYLDPTVAFVSASPPTWSLDNLNNILTFTNLPVLGSNQFLTVSAVVKPTALGENLTYANCYPAPTVTQLFKDNADASVKTVVVFPLMLTVLTPSPNTLLLAWPAGQGLYHVQVATNLAPPINWTTITNPAPFLLNGQYIFTNTIGPGDAFFRLNSANP